MLRGRALVQNIYRAALNFRSGFCKRHRYGLLQHFHGFGQLLAQCSGQNGLPRAQASLAGTYWRSGFTRVSDALGATTGVTVTLDFAGVRGVCFDLFGGGREQVFDCSTHQRARCAGLVAHTIN